MKKGFTLAEVLITLGIIGIVAALTIPGLVQNYRKQAVETRLKKFYSSFNQAIKLSEVENGDKASWDDMKVGYNESGENNSVFWYDKYIKKYLKVMKTEKGKDNEARLKIYFVDGSLLTIASTTWLFYPFAKDYTEAESPETGFIQSIRSAGGTKLFTFVYNKNGIGVEPFGLGANLETLKNQPDQGCYTKNVPITSERAYCSALIQYYGWTIPKDYALKF